MTEYTFSERDEFHRKPIAEKIISLLQSEIDISPLVIDGSWGTGKSEFCQKLMNLMAESDSHELIYIDAFKADHANEPLMTVLAEVIKVLPTEEAQTELIKKAVPAIRYGLKTIAKAGVSHLLRQDATEVVDEFDKEIQQTADKVIDASVESLLKDHIESEQSLKNLQDALASIAAQKPIVLFIDELDRCKPSFAVDMLEIIKHTFDVDGVSFVLITNTQQLKASINHCYGESVDEQKYLDKFIKLSITLPHTVKSQYQRETIASIQHYKNLVNRSPILKDLNLSGDGIIRIIEFITIENQLSLREIETIVRHIEIYKTLTASECHLNTNRISGYKLLALFTIAVYCINPTLASDIVHRKVDAKDIGNFLGISSLPTETNSNHHYEALIICYLLGRNSRFNRKLFKPSDESEKFWIQLSQSYFNMQFFHEDNDNYLDTCENIIKTLSMS